MKMKKTLTVLFVTLVSFQLLNAQTNPALLTNFHIEGNVNSGYKVSWKVANNEVAHNFEVQESIDGRTYTPLTSVTASQKTGAETYAYSLVGSRNNKLMYRLKMTSKGQETYYSNIIILTVKNLSTNKVDLLGNPVKDKLTLRFNEFQNGIVEIKIFDMAGRMIDDRKINDIEKNEVVNIPFNTPLACGMYVVEINNGIEKITNKFIKQ
jgi:hypothetical protein